MIGVVTVNKHGKAVGTMERLAAHKRPGTLHRAISIVLYRCRNKGRRKGANAEILLQKRSEKKPLWPLYWANTVCTHPLPGEQNIDCAVRRLKEEMGILINKSELKELYTFTYQADYNQDLSEHEFDMVIIGKYQGDYALNSEEAEEAKWVELAKLKVDVEKNPEIYAPWPKFIFRYERLLNEIG